MTDQIRMASEENSENEEFMNLATAQSEPDDDDDGPSAAPRAISKGEAPKKSEGEPEQWARNGEGFVGVSATIKTLPPGVYSIEIINQTLTFLRQKVVTDDLLRLPDSKSDMVISEIERFWKMKPRFQQFGFSYKRGFLLWGPPGSGKTSTLAFITQQLVAEGGVVLLANSNPAGVAFMLQMMRKVEPERRMIVLLEDIDTIIRRYGEAEVLAILDGELSVDNVVYLATTNYPEHLDGRVVNRPSRFDRVVKIDVPSPEAREAYLRSRGLSLSDEEMKRWVRESDGFSIAHLKELIVGVLCYENPFDKEIQRLKSMKRTPKSDDPNTPMGFGGRK
jgi:hypothetical protein